MAALAPSLPVTLLSAPGAGLAGGCGWWQALIRAARAAHPGTPCVDILDCADAPGMAMAALRLQQAVLVLHPASPAFAAVCEVARLQAAIVLPTAPESLDLARKGSFHRLEAHLRATAQQMVTDPARDSAESLR